MNQELSPQTEKKSIFSRNLIILMIAAFFSQACVQLYYSFLTVHSLSLGAPSSVATLMPNATMLFTIFSMIIAGVIADRTGRRKQLLIIGMIAAFVANILMANAIGWLDLFLYRLIFAGLYSTFLTLFNVLFIMELPQEKRGTAIALFMGMGTLGTFVFQVTSGYWVAAYGYSILYYVGAILAVACILALLAVKAPIVKSERRISAGDIGKAIGTFGVWYPSLVVGIRSVSFMAFVVVVPIYVMHILGMSPEILGVMFGVNTLVCSIAQLASGPIVDRYGPKLLLLLSGVISALLYFTLPYLGSFGVYGVAAVLFGVSFFYLFSMTTPQYCASRSVEPVIIVTAINVAYMVTMIFSIVASFSGGPLLESVGWENVLYVCAILAIVSTVLSFAVPKFKSH